MVGLYKDDKRINKETMIDILMKMSSLDNEYVHGITLKTTINDINKLH